MIKITNRHGMPQPLVDAVTFDPYVKEGHMSATEVIDSPRIRVLKKKAMQDGFMIEQDAVDMIWALFGSSVHGVIERAVAGNYDMKTDERIKALENFRYRLEREGHDTKILDEEINEIKEKANKFKSKTGEYMVEERLFSTIKGWTISGKLDLFHIPVAWMYDFKVTSAWSIVYRDDKTSWDKQLNVYKYLMEDNGYHVNGGSIIAILKDFDKKKAGDGVYPDTPAVNVPVPLYKKENIEKYIVGRVELHQKAENAFKSNDDDSIPECTDEERWYRGEKFAIMKEGRKSAVKLYTASEAEKMNEDFEKLVAEKKGKYSIEFRRGTNMRCEEYCPVVKYCSQAKRLGVMAAQ